MFIQMSIHHPRQGKEELLVDSMHRFGAAISTQQGHRWNRTMRDEKTGRLVGIAVWDSKEDMLAARPVMEESVKDDDFEDWEERENETFYLHEI